MLFQNRNPSSDLPESVDSLETFMINFIDFEQPALPLSFKTGRVDNHSNQPNTSRHNRS